MHNNYSNQNKFEYLSDQIYVNNDSQDALKHIQSLRTRLSFAQFKLNNGWENNSIFDVESFWKKRQRKLMNDIPTPRFTQQDIIDKKFHTIKKRTRSPSQSPKKLKQQKSEQTFYFYHHNNNSMIKTPELQQQHSKSSFDASFVPSDENCEPAIVKNSLDYLSYAIAITEKNNNRQNSEQSLPNLTDGEDEDEEDKLDWTRTSQLRLSLSIPSHDVLML